MRAVRTRTTNFTYVGSPPEILDLPCRIEGHLVFSVWLPSTLEREAIAQGANIELGVVGHPIPPVSIAVTDEKPAPPIEAPIP
jgi:hypothetical protein